MEQRIFHGDFTPNDLSECLSAHFNRGNFVVNNFESVGKVFVQILTRQNAQSGGQTALTVTFMPVEDGVAVTVGEQALISVAASLGFSALAALRHPLNLLNRLDDIAQDIESIQLGDEVWRVLDANARALGSGHDLSERLRRVMCEYCLTANHTGASSCIACGAPLGNAQPKTCGKCGYVVRSSETRCPNCKSPLTS